jgi:hypothetical protein
LNFIPFYSPPSLSSQFPFIPFNSIPNHAILRYVGSEEVLSRVVKVQGMAEEAVEDEKIAKVTSPLVGLLVT